MSKSDRGTPGITLDDAIEEVHTLVDDAMEFRVSELEEEWADAEAYYNGATSLEEFEGRSNVTKTEVRDAVRNTMPSVMRILMQARRPVEYLPSSVQHAPWVEQQGDYVRQLFAKNGGYMVLHDSILEALKLKIGPIKAFWEPNPQSTYFKYTRVPFSTVEELSADPLVNVEDFVRSPNEGNSDGGDVPLYDVTGTRAHENGKIVLENVPNYEFFISRNCSSIEQAIHRGIHGQQRVVSVQEAQNMGLTYEDWLTLDVEDPETSDHGASSTERRGYHKTDPNEQSSADVLRHQFLLTEAYVSYDLENEGNTQLYVFYLGGTSYEYLHHERVEDSPFSIVKPIPIPSNAYGHSLADLTMNEQDTSSSLLRAAVDNAHAANDARIAADPTKTNFDDIMNPALNAPIRKRSGDTMQVIQVPFTGQGNLQLLEYLDRDIQSKIGITKAAQGLDPDALQSTDKDAVRNTIATAQGQTELMVRNIVETGLIRLFRILLRLSIQHQSPKQLMLVKGTLIPVNTLMFDPDAAAEPAVGIGTASAIQKQMALSFVLNEQKAAMDKYGPNNPFTSLAQMYNTYEDILETQGIFHTQRYFKIVTPEVEAAWAQKQEEQKAMMMKAQQENAPMDPSKAFLQVEKEKRDTERQRYILENQSKERDRALRALETAEKLDIERDDLIQTRVIEFAKLEKNTTNEEGIKREQASNERISTGGKDSSKKAGTE